MAENDFVPGTMDIEDQKKTYVGVMKFSGFWGMPASIGLGVFFTSLLVGSGIPVAILMFILTFIFVRVGVKMFFAH